MFVCTPYHSPHVINDNVAGNKWPLSETLPIIH